MSLDLFFKQRNESLILKEIIDNKKITAVTIACLSSARQLKEAVIKDDGIEFLYDGKSVAAALIFKNKKVYEELSGQFDPSSLWILKTKSIGTPYLVHFHIDNLINIQWEN